MKAKIVSVLIGASMLATALPALAADFTNVQFQNGDVTVSGKGGSTVQATFRLTVPVGEVVEWVQTDVVGDDLGPKDKSVGGSLGLQEGTHDVVISVKLPPNTGTYDLDVQGAGIFGGIRAINGDDNVVASDSFSGALRVVADSDDSSDDSNDSDTPPSWLAALIAALLGNQNPPTPPAPVVNPKCTLIAPYVNAAPYAYSAQGVQLQSALLLDNPNSIPLLAAGSTLRMGYFGAQTHDALNRYQSQYGCH